MTGDGNEKRVLGWSVIVVAAAVLMAIVVMVVAHIRATREGYDHGPALPVSDRIAVPSFFEEHRSLFEDIRDGFGDCYGTIRPDEQISLVDAGGGPCEVGESLRGLTDEYFSLGWISWLDAACIRRVQAGVPMPLEFVFRHDSEGRDIGVAYQGSSSVSWLTEEHRIDGDWYFYERSQ
jgi:hypothetical protein